MLAALAVHGAPRLIVETGDGASQVVLRGHDAARQLLATAIAEAGAERDLTRHATWSVSPPTLAEADATGRVTPLANGNGTVRVVAGDGTAASIPVVVQEFDTEQPIHFANQIVPIFTKYGCNGGGCHGKAAGQNGFRLSLLGFEPSEDYEHLVREARGRRLFPAAPERSLILEKATARVPHGGGKRLETGSDDYNLLVRWIRQGMPVGAADAPTVTRISVFPLARTLGLDSSQQLIVTAHYSDGTTIDVTRSALYEANDKDLARCDEDGLLTVFHEPGEISVMVRYQGKVGTFRGTIPLGIPVTRLPPARNFVDDQVFRRLKEVGMPPSDVCDDATFLRRVTLDIAGRLPTLAEIQGFANAGSDRQAARDAVIDRLLDSPGYADYFANKWSALLRNRRAQDRDAHATTLFHDWIRDCLLRNKPYDDFVREIIAASGEVAENPAVAWYRQERTMQSQLEDVAQVFLGQRLRCAQCHHHPYERWSQADYWSFGAFFSRIAYKPGDRPGEETIASRRGLAKAINKKNGQTVIPAGLGDPIHGLSADADPRLALADWMTRPDNRFFARALVNRYWKHFLGRGLVDPEDDMRDTNPPSHPELLEGLATEFEKSGYDLKGLVRILTRSTTYQLSALPNAWNTRDKYHFARFQPRRLPAEVLYDAIDTLLGSESRFDGLPIGTRAICLPDNSYNASSYFLTVFGRPENSSACECERSTEASLGQSLHLLNARELQDHLAADDGRPARLARDSSRCDEAKLHELYLLAYGRDPDPEEEKIGLEHLAAGRRSATDEAARNQATRRGWEDIVWALLNTKEFLFNH